jgi:SAM-dependent methyltransferase
MPTTLHELEREVANDQAQNDYWARTRRNILQSWFGDLELDSILDIGCGSGYLANSISRDDSIVSGVDIDRESVGLAAKRPNIDLAVVGDAANLSYASGTFDCVLMGDVMEHFEDPHPVLKEANRVLSQDGKMIISVPAFRWLWGPHDEHNNHAERYTASRLSDAISETGLVLDKYRYTNFFPLLPYFVMQQIIKRGVPSEARGEHNRFVELVKKVLIFFEKNIRFPLGITLLGICSKSHDES